MWRQKGETWEQAKERERVDKHWRAVWAKHHGGRPRETEPMSEVDQVGWIVVGWCVVIGLLLWLAVTLASHH